MSEENTVDQMPVTGDGTLSISLADLKEARRAQMRAAVQQELQVLMVEASQYRKKITDAKTQYKKVFYGKKMKKVSDKIMQMLVALQQLGPAPQVTTGDAREEQENAPPEEEVENNNNTSDEQGLAVG